VQGFILKAIRYFFGLKYDEFSGNLKFGLILFECFK